MNECKKAAEQIIECIELTEANRLKKDIEGKAYYLGALLECCIEFSDVSLELQLVNGQPAVIITDDEEVLRDIDLIGETLSKELANYNAQIKVYWEIQPVDDFTEEFLQNVLAALGDDSYGRSTFLEGTEQLTNMSFKILPSFHKNKFDIVFYYDKYLGHDYACIEQIISYAIGKKNADNLIDKIRFESNRIPRAMTKIIFPITELQKQLQEACKKAGITLSEPRNFY